MRNNKFCFGTAKLDTKNYGFSSSNKDRELEDIFRLCKFLNINNFDTSPRYGRAEEILGNYINKYKIEKNFISTKIDSLSKDDVYSQDKIEKSLINSLNLLSLEKVDLVYLHQNDLNIISDKFILKGLEKLKINKLTNEIGASIYNLNELNFALECEIFDWIQIPVNILDTSFYHHAINSVYNKKIAARSIFLQGLIPNYSNMDKIKQKDKLKKSISNLKKIIEQSDLDYLSVVTSYIFSLEKLSMIILGSGSVTNIKNNLINANTKLNKETILDLNNLSFKQAPWTNPRHWYDK